MIDIARWGSALLGSAEGGAQRELSPWLLNRRGIPRLTWRAWADCIPRRRLGRPWKEIRSIADVAQPRQPLYAVGRGERLDGPCSILFRLARLALAHSPRAIRFPEPRSDRTGCEALLVRPA